MPCRELVCFGIVESIHWQTASSDFLCLFSTALEHLLTFSIEVNLDKLFSCQSPRNRWIWTVYASKNIASLKFDNSMYNFTIVSAKERETKYFYFNLFFYGENGEFNHHRNFSNTHFFSARFVMYYRSP